MKKIAVVGSVNVDLVFTTDILPNMGETVTGENFYLEVGGKGANQSVACARLGGDVTFFGSIGTDVFANNINKRLIDEHVKCNLNVSDRHSGVAQVNIYDSDNSIIVIPGANWDFNNTYLEKIESMIDNYDVFVFQLEIPLEAVERLVRTIRTRSLDKVIILNPAPATALSEELLEAVDYITPNEHEIKTIVSKFSSVESTLKQFPEKMIVTLGSEGVKYYDKRKQEFITVKSMENAEVVDTTGAGDTFSGAFSYAIANNLDIHEAINFSNVAAGISISRLGAQGGMPILEEVNKHLKKGAENAK